MAKKFVRGITDIKNIEHQDFDTNNVNDLLSDGKHNYIHRKKQDGSEEYHNLTNNLKNLQSDNTDLLTVTNYNNTTNSATIRPKHDSQKEQLLESTDETIIISHGENGTDETTSVDVNPEKVLEHDNLLTDYGLKKTTSGDSSKLSLKPTWVQQGFDLNTLTNGVIVGAQLTNAPNPNQTFIVTSYTEADYSVQQAIKLLDPANVSYTRLHNTSGWGAWREQVGDKSVIDTLLAQKQNTLTSNASIGVDGTGLRHLYTLSQTYTHANAFLKTHVKSVSQNTSVSTAEEEFHFLAKMNKTQTSASFTLNEHDTAVFEYLIDTYGENGTVNIHGSAFSLNGSTLTFLNNTGAQYNPHVIKFSDIIPASSIYTTQSAPSVQKGDSMTVEKVDEIVDKTLVTEKEQTE